MKNVFERLKPLLAIYRYRLPNIVTTKVSSCMPAVFRGVIRKKINPSSIFILSGNEKNSGFPIRSLVVGNRIIALYLASIIYNGDFDIEEVREFAFHGTEPKINARKMDIIIVLTNSLSSSSPANEFIAIPNEVNFTFDLSHQLETIFSKLNRRRRRSIQMLKKLGYSYEITDDDTKFRLFYDKMYCPYVSERHKPFVKLESFAYLKQLFKKGGLLLVKRDKTYVSGILFSLVNKTVWTPCMGIFEEHAQDKHVTRTAGDALLYFLIIWAKEQGYNKINYGNSKPFLNDGVVRYKREWQMSVRQHGERLILTKPCNFEKGVRSFLMGNPFIFFDGQSLKGLAFVDHEHPVTRGEVEKILRQYYTSGMTSLLVISTSGFERNQHSIAAFEIEEAQIPDSLSCFSRMAGRIDGNLKLLEIRKTGDDILFRA